MREYRLTVFEAGARHDVSFVFEAQADRDAVRLGAEAAAGQAGVLWREGRLLLSLEPFGLDLAHPAHWAGAD
jgi:hypothetical protein